MFTQRFRTWKIFNLLLLFLLFWPLLFAQHNGIHLTWTWIFFFHKIFVNLHQPSFFFWPKINRAASFFNWKFGLFLIEIARRKQKLLSKHWKALKGSKGGKVSQFFWFQFLFCSNLLNLRWSLKFFYGPYVYINYRFLLFLPHFPPFSSIFVHYFFHCWVVERKIFRQLQKSEWTRRWCEVDPWKTLKASRGCLGVFYRPKKACLFQFMRVISWIFTFFRDKMTNCCDWIYWSFLIHIILTLIIAGKKKL